MPTWQMRLLIRAAFTAAGPSSMVRLSGFSTKTSLPALSASIVIGTCQWSGVPISATSISLLSSSARWSLNVRALGASSFALSICIERVNRDWHVPVVRRADQRHVDILVIEQRAVVAECPRVGRVQLRLVDLRAPDIAQRRHLHVAGLDEIARVIAAAFATTDQAELYALIGAVNARVR